MGWDTGWEPKGEIALICFTRKGAELGRRILECLREDGIFCKGYVKASFLSACTGAAAESSSLTAVTEPLTEWMREQFGRAEGLIFVGAVGIAVRAAAPYIKDKFQDPALVVVDEKGTFAIPVLSGHMGGANDLARRISRKLGATPVITTATDLRGKFAVDVAAREMGLWISSREKAKQVSADLLEGKPVGFFSDFAVKGELPEGCVPGYLPDHPFGGMPVHPSGGSLNLPSRSSSCSDDASRLSGCSDAPSQWSSRSDDAGQLSGHTDDPIRDGRRRRSDIAFTVYDRPDCLCLVPRILTLGIGCRRGISFEKLRAEVMGCLARERLFPQAVCQVATIDIKREEEALSRLCGEMGWAFCCFSAEELKGLEGSFSHSDFVEETVGVGNVCERAAVLGSRGELVLKKQRLEGVTLAAALAPWQVVL